MPVIDAPAAHQKSGPKPLFAEEIEQLFPQCTPYINLPTEKKRFWRKKFWASKHPDAHRLKMAAKARRHRRSRYPTMREQVVQALGGKCACCGIAEKRFLNIDHIERTGGMYRKGYSSYDHLKQIIREGCPRDKYRILCWNCNCSTKHGNVCPHNASEASAFFDICRSLSQNLFSSKPVMELGAA